MKKLILTCIVVLLLSLVFMLAIRFLYMWNNPINVQRRREERGREWEEKINAVRVGDIEPQTEFEKRIRRMREQEYVEFIIESHEANGCPYLAEKVKARYENADFRRKPIRKKESKSEPISKPVLVNKPSNKAPEKEGFLPNNPAIFGGITNYTGNPSPAEGEIVLY